MKLGINRICAPARVALVAGCLFLGVALLVLVRPRPGLDETVAGWFGSRQVPWLVAAMEIVRLLGSQLPLVLTPVVSIIVWRRRSARDGGILLGTVAATLVFSVAVKLMTARPRPGFIFATTAGEGYGSFPSSSVAIAVVFWGVSLVVLGRGTSRRVYRAALVAGALAIALVGVSRLYVGEHWLSDVVAGYLLGLVMLAIGVQLRFPGTRQMREEGRRTPTAVDQR